MFFRNVVTRMRQVIQRLLPTAFKERLRRATKARRNQSYCKQKLTELEIEGFSLKVPKRHLLVELRRWQPLRDQCVKIVAQHVFKAYPSDEAIDVGANVGDTAAMLSAGTDVPLILVEGSDYFFPLLTENAKQFPNQTTLIQAMVGSGTPVHGHLQHWGGTARFEEDSKNTKPTMTIRLDSIASELTRLIKIDTDGFDYGILRNSKPFLEARQPVLLYENETRNAADVKESLETLGMLEAVGYRHFILWDDAGHLVGAFESVQGVVDIIRCLYVNKRLNKGRDIHGLDIAAFAVTDRSIAAAVLESYRALMVAMVGVTN